ncbi:hypothetical protein Nmel_006522 [Mimus melanotis]
MFGGKRASACFSTECVTHFHKHLVLSESNSNLRTPRTILEQKQSGLVKCISQMLLFTEVLVFIMCLLKLNYYSFV